LTAKKIDGIEINLADLENGKAIAYDKINKIYTKNFFLILIYTKNII